ncbi:hypothetical protein B0T10DRAFT_197893 [Thelonectria olida]|uniref:Uncharacterized protein n=1 Tax=Thelonectria olida TaxID=1576542 RepID=A0A9P9AJT0_9HYPO|nr:hypothetical protein B0T10DRAFT_197893 [Thelonectria olida]
MAAPSEDEFTWTLESSHRLTPGISLHTFSRTKTGDLHHGDITINILPTQTITLQFPPDLDPIAGSHNLSEQDRRLDFTPCHLEHDSSGTTTSFSFLSGNGRVTGLIGLPRPQGQLAVKQVDSGGGFPEELTVSSQAAICIAGGTGIAPFLTLPSKQAWKTSNGSRSSLVCSIRGHDFPIIEFFLERKMLRPEDWARVFIHVTPGEDVDGLPAGRSESWWKMRFEHVVQQFPGPVQFSIGRLTEELLASMLQESKDILFCGSKSLEWQVKMWSLGKASVRCTER